MGKCGARELNSISDVDVVCVVAPVEPPPLAPRLMPGQRGRCPLKLTENEGSTIGTELEHALTRAIMGPGTRTRPLGVDANLRPEGTARSFAPSNPRSVIQALGRKLGVQAAQRRALSPVRRS